MAAGASICLLWQLISLKLGNISNTATAAHRCMYSNQYWTTGLTTSELD